MVDAASADPFFVLGAAKCGTTSVHRYLDQHPEVCMSEPKEPTFFEFDREFEQGVEWYRRRYFSHYQGERWCGDARQRNLFLPWVPPRIHRQFPRAKLIVLVRNPVERAHSHYWHNVRHDREPLSFSDAVYEDVRRIRSGRRLRTSAERRRYQEEADPSGLYRTYLDSGYYAEQIQRYLEEYSRDRLRVVVYQSLVESPATVCRELFAFLDVTQDVPLDVTPRNVGYRPRSRWLHRAMYYGGALRLAEWIPASLKRLLKRANRAGETGEGMDELVRLWLHEHFESHNRALREALDLDLEHWRHPLQEGSLSP